MKIFLVLLTLLCPVLSLNAQKERKIIRDGNSLYESGDFEKAQIEYQKALEMNANSFEAAFNLGDAFFKKEKYGEAEKEFRSLIDSTGNAEQQGAVWYNLGNSLIAAQKVDEAIEAYKNSLRLRPDSKEAKYNLAYALDMKKNKDQQDQNKDQQDQNKDQQDQNKDQQDQNKDQQNQNKDQQDQNKDQQDQNKDQQDQNKDQQDQNKDQQNQNKDQQNQNKDQQQGEETKISREDAERLLNLLNSDEKDIRDEVKKKQVEAMKAKKIQIEKDW